MRVALLSDIHGNLIALNAVLADLASRGPFDEVVVAGDLVWAGPWPAEVVDRVCSMESVVIQGNTDAFFRLRPNETPPGKRESRFAEQMEAPVRDAWVWWRLPPPPCGQSLPLLDHWKRQIDRNLRKQEAFGA